MALSLAQSADRQMSIYFEVCRLVEEHDIEALDNEIEDYRSDAHAYDVYSEGPAEYVADNGYRPGAPLTPERRQFFKQHGLRFRADGRVEYVGK